MFGAVARSIIRSHKSHLFRSPATQTADGHFIVRAPVFQQARSPYLGCDPEGPQFQMLVVFGEAAASHYFICKSPFPILAAIPNAVTLLEPLHNSYNKIPSRTPKYIVRVFHTILIYRIV